MAEYQQMNRNAALSLLALPIFAASYVAFAPGIAFAKTPLSSSLAPTVFRQSGSFSVDPMHTFVGFDIGHLGLSRVQGRFDKLAGSIRVDTKNPDNSSVQITLQTDSVDTNVAPRDADLRSVNFFEATKYPEMTFSSNHIHRKGKGYVAEGILTLKGVVKPLTLSFKVYGPIKDPWGGNRVGILADPVTIHRSEFGMTYDADSISDDVTVRISLEATEDKAK